VEIAIRGSSTFFSLNQTDMAARKMLRLRDHMTATKGLQDQLIANCFIRTYGDDDCKCLNDITAPDSNDDLQQ
jgi:hypothetical protein